MEAHERVLKRVEEIARETFEVERFAGDVMQRLVRDGASAFWAYKRKGTVPPQAVLERMAGQMVAIAFAYEEKREHTVGYIK